nr:MAG TPA: DNA-binding protein [Caudoviricetes sp.]
MRVDTDKIEWLLKNATQYEISINTRVAQSTISNIVNGKRQLKNLTIEIGDKLTAYAIKKQRSVTVPRNVPTREDVDS